MPKLIDLDGSTITVSVVRMLDDKVLVLDLANTDDGAFWITRAGFDLGRVDVVPLADWPVH